jgi:hypothetical protein
MKTICTFAAVGVLGFWALLTGLMCIGGLADAISPPPWRPEGCTTRAARIEYVLPGYRLGCWLGESP